MNLEAVFKNTVFLLGAGASYEADCKLSSGMLTSLQSEISKIEDVRRQKLYMEIYSFIRATLNFQHSLKNPTSGEFSPNIEDFFLILNQLIDKEFIIPHTLIGSWNEKITKWELQESSVFFDLREFILNLLLNDWLKFSETKAKDLLSPLESILTNSENFTAEFFSLNYDLTFETILNSAHANVLCDGFENEAWKGHFADRKLNYYKLHGSINWYLDDEEELIKKASATDHVKPFVIFGSDYKMHSFDPFFFLLSKFRDRLENSILYIVIGYSFSDKYINNMLIQQLMFKQSNRLMLIVDPHRDSEQAFLNELAKVQESRITTQPLNFTKLSQNLIRIEKSTTAEFYRKCFSNNAEYLVDLIGALQKEETVF